MTSLAAFFSPHPHPPSYSLNENTEAFKIYIPWDFPGGTVVKNLPANSGDMGSSPGPGRTHMPHATKPMCHNY